MWSYDFCTVCDKQCAAGSMYCSDSCRLAEMDTSSSQSSDWVYSELNYSPNRSHSQHHQHTTSALNCKTSSTQSQSSEYTSSPNEDYFSIAKPATPGPAVTAAGTQPDHQAWAAAQAKSFLYASPLLLPQTGVKIPSYFGTLLNSPPPSPLLMSLMHEEDDDSDFESSTPTSLPVGVSSASHEKPRFIPHIGFEDSQEDHFKGSTNYRRWLTAE